MTSALSSRHAVREHEFVLGDLGADSGLPVASPACWLTADPAYQILTNGLVSQWSDHSGNANHAVQSTAAKRGPQSHHPAYLRRRPLVYTNGTNDWIHYVIAGVTAGRPSSGFFVGMWAGPQGSNRSTMIGSTADSSRQFCIESDGKLTLLKGGIAIILASTLSVSQGAPFVAGYRLDTNLAEIRLNALTAQSNTDNNALTANQTALGLKSTGTGDPQPFVGLYAEVLLYNSGLTSQQMADTMAWLKTRWGI